MLQTNARKVIINIDFFIVFSFCVLCYSIYDSQIILQYKIYTWLNRKIIIIDTRTIDQRIIIADFKATLNVSDESN